MLDGRVLGASQVEYKQTILGNPLSRESIFFLGTQRGLGRLLCQAGGVAGSGECFSHLVCNEE